MKQSIILKLLSMLLEFILQLAGEKEKSEKEKDEAIASLKEVHDVEMDKMNQKYDKLLKEHVADSNLADSLRRQYPTMSDEAILREIC